MVQEKKHAEISNPKGREMRIMRMLNAPHELVWEVWTKPEHIKKWWGPDGFTNTIHKMDVNPGGECNLIMYSPDGTNFINEIVFVEVVKPEKIVFDHINAPRFRVTVTFETMGPKTIINYSLVFETPDETTPQGRGVKVDGGLIQTINRMTAYVEAPAPLKEVTLTRILNAPLDIVFNAWVKPKQLQKWWGPKCFTNPVCEINPMKDGKIYIEMEGPNGISHPMTGTYEEVIENEKIIFTSAALDKDGKPLFEVHNTILFYNEGSKTKLVVKAVVTSATEQAKPYLAGMDQGWSQSIEKLEELVKTCETL